MPDSGNGAVLSKPLYEMFNAIPPRYDFLNHLITFGLDVRWRLSAAKECLAAQPHRVLDLCCGTGDLALNVAQLAGKRLDVQGLDYSQRMLDIAAKKARSAGRNVLFIQGEAAAMPFPDGYFDCVGTSFAFRNLTYKNPLAQRHITEVWRVLAPGGKFVIVETSQPESSVTRAFYHLYLRLFVRRVGSWVSGNKGAYHYLAESAARFYSSGEMRKLLLSAGFRHFSCRPFLFGAAALYTAVK